MKEQVIYLIHAQNKMGVEHLLLTGAAVSSLAHLDLQLAVWMGSLDEWRDINELVGLDDKSRDYHCH